MTFPLPILLSLTAALAFSQNAPLPAFEVASIKPSTDPAGSSSGITTEKGRIRAQNVTLRRCIRGAYNLPESQVLGGPRWADEERYNIDANAPGPSGDHDLMLMLQSLLAERFQLVLHPETRPLAGYALVVDRTGLKAHPSAPGAASRTNSRRDSLDAEGCTMSQLALKLSEVIHLPVANLTQLEGAFDFTLKWIPEDPQTKAPSTAEVGPSIFQAVREQLGLRLEARKIPTPVLIIDSAAKPSRN